MKSTVILFSIILIVNRCGTSIPLDVENQLIRPVGLTVTALSGQKMLVQYTVQNQERTFDGYNLAIARTTIGDGEAASLPPLTITGSYPTFIHSNADYNPNVVISQTLSRFTNTLPFEVGTTYFFRLIAHSRKDPAKNSLPSNEVSATGMP